MTCKISFYPINRHCLLLLRSIIMAFYAAADLSPGRLSVLVRLCISNSFNLFNVSVRVNNVMCTQSSIKRGSLFV